MNQNKKPPIPNWLQQINEFADALGDRAELRSKPFFRDECKDDVEYMRKAARLLKMMAVAYYDLSCQVNSLYNHEMRLEEIANEAIETVRKQVKSG